MCCVSGHMVLASSCREAVSEDWAPSDKAGILHQAQGWGSTAKPEDSLMCLKKWVDKRTFHLSAQFTS